MYVLCKCLFLMPKVILGRLCVNRMIGKKLRAWTGGAKETGKRQVDFLLSNESDHESTPSFSKIKIIKEQA